MSDGKNKRGFASMDADTRRQIASAGGKAVHAQGKGHEFTSEEARRAGAKGGAVVARNVAYMAEIGRRGGLARQRKSSGRGAHDAD
jgi:general stress protein YciG